MCLFIFWKESAEINLNELSQLPFSFKEIPPSPSDPSLKRKVRFLEANICKNHKRLKDTKFKVAKNGEALRPWLFDCSKHKSLDSNSPQLEHGEGYDYLS
jgi:hypothetical protein